MIAFVGSVFSPYYAWSRRFGAGDPLRHCTVNVALYGPTRGWAMTERRGARRTATDLVIGASSLRWDGTTLTMSLDERGMPIPRRLRGEIRVHPQAFTGATYRLDAAGRHRWSPIAPRSRIEVDLHAPALRWSGPGYFDSNEGDAPLEDSFTHWNWSRTDIGDRSAILYEVGTHGDPGAALALQIDKDGAVTDLPPPPAVALPRTRWRVARATRSEQGGAAVIKTLEDTPFYARSVLRTHLLGRPATAMHESLSLRRFRSPIVQAMLPFRMPRFG